MKFRANPVRFSVSFSLLALLLGACGAAPESLEDEAEAHAVEQASELQKVDAVGDLPVDEITLDDGEPVEQELRDKWGYRMCNDACLEQYGDSYDDLDACAAYCNCAFNSDTNWVLCWATLADELRQ